MGVVNNLIDILKLKDRVTKLEKGGGGSGGGQSISKYRMSMSSNVTYPYTFKKYKSEVQTVDFDVLVIDKDGTKIGVPIAHEPIEIVLEKESMGTLSAADTLYQNSKTFDFLFISGEEVSSMLGTMYTAGQIHGEMNNIIGDMDVNLLFNMKNKVTMDFVSHPDYSVAENLRLDKKIIIH